MFKLRIGYLISGIATGLILLFSFVWSLPDGKLHIVFCNVGQGDSTYVRFPDGRDMLVDGGPNDKILACLGRHMPFWDRTINLVILTHPQKDHLQGLITVLGRYKADYFLRSDIGNTGEGYGQLLGILKDKNIPVKFVSAGEKTVVGTSTLSFIWPSQQYLARLPYSDSPGVLGVSAGEMNDYSVVFLLRYGTFDAFFPGDADSHVEGEFSDDKLADDTVELLKVPHHGAKTAMTEKFVQWLHPQLSIISVGKNSYGHPNQETLNLLALIGSRVMRTDKDGDIEIVSDGKKWDVRSEAP